MTFSIEVSQKPLEREKSSYLQFYSPQTHQAVDSRTLNISNSETTTTYYCNKKLNISNFPEIKKRLDEYDVEIEKRQNILQNIAIEFYSVIKKSKTPFPIMLMCQDRRQLFQGFSPPRVILKLHDKKSYSISVYGLNSRKTSVQREGNLQFQKTLRFFLPPKQSENIKKICNQLQYFSMFTTCMFFIAIALYLMLEDGHRRFKNSI